MANTIARNDTNISKNNQPYIGLKWKDEYSGSLMKNYSTLATYHKATGPTSVIAYYGLNLNNVSTIGMSNEGGQLLMSPNDKGWWRRDQEGTRHNVNLFVYITVGT